MFKKKLLSKIILALMFIFGFNIIFSHAQNFYYDYNDGGIAEDNTNLGAVIKDDSVTPQNGIVYKLRQAFKLTGGIYERSDQKAIDYIKMIINIALWLVGFISLILLIYAFYLMFFTAEEEGLAKAKKILKGILIALVVMGISYFIVSFIFFIYNITTGTGWG